MEKPIIDLRGPEGNAFALMSLVQKISKNIGVDSKTIIAKMMVSDYENLVNVFEENFRDYVKVLK